MDVFSREAFRDLIRVKSELVEVKGLGKIPLRQFSHNELDAYNEMRRSENRTTRREAVPWLIKRCVLDKPGGTQVLTDEDLVFMGEQGDGLALDRLFAALLKFSNADSEAVDRAGESSAETSISDSESDSASLSASPSEGS